MLHYLEFIVIRKTGNMEKYVTEEDILQRQFRMIHGWLGDVATGDVGLYFPDYVLDTFSPVPKSSLGLRIRLVGEKKYLEDARVRCSRINCVHVLPVQPVPDVTRYVATTRVKFYTASQERRLARRAEREICLDRVNQLNEKKNLFPRMHNILTTSGEVIPVFAVKQVLENEARHGQYNTYGMAHEGGATNPFF